MIGEIDVRVMYMSSVEHQQCWPPPDTYKYNHGLGGNICFKNIPSEKLVLLLFDYFKIQLLWFDYKLQRL